MYLPEAQIVQVLREQRYLEVLKTLNLVKDTAYLGMVDADKYKMCHE